MIKWAVVSLNSSDFPGTTSQSCLPNDPLKLNLMADIQEKGENFGRKYYTTMLIYWKSAEHLIRMLMKLKGLNPI